MTYHEVRELLTLARAGTRLDSLLTIGRQNLFLHERDLTRLARAFRLEDEVLQTARPFGRFADAFLGAAVGVRSVTSLDASNYEGADLIHNLNRPTPAELGERFDAVVDGGRSSMSSTFPLRPRA